MSTHPVIADRDLGQLRSPTPLGYNPSLQCWCGDSLPLNYRQDDMTTQLNSFLDQHEECPASEVQH